MQISAQVKLWFSLKVLVLVSNCETLGTIQGGFHMFISHAYYSFHMFITDTCLLQNSHVDYHRFTCLLQKVG